jgi:anti-sigma regulatory factor (Ser/Thr protein kinase)
MSGSASASATPGAVARPAAAGGPPNVNGASAVGPGLGPGASGHPLPVPPPGYRGIIAGAWPLQDAIELGPLSGAVPCARLHARQMLWEWGLTQLTEDVELLVSELVTNAIAPPQSGDRVSPVRLWLRADRTRVLILVWDASPQPPTPVDAGDDAESGRGLLLVEAVSQKWDWYFPQSTDGKVVWALAGPELPAW